MTSRSAPRPTARSAEAWSLSMTASIPSKASSRRTTGIPPPPGGDDELPRLEERSHGLELHHLERLRRGHDAPPAAPGHLAERPAAVVLQLPRADARVVRPDRLRRALEGGVGGVDDDVRDHDGHRPAGDGRSSAAASVPISACVCATATQSGSGGASAAASSWRRSSFPTCGPFPCVTTTSPSRSGATAANVVGEVRAVLGGGPALPGPEERVPAEGDHGQHGASCPVRLLRQRCGPIR